MIEITENEAEKHNAKIIENIYGAKIAIIEGIAFVINPRITEFTNKDDDETTNIPTIG